MSDVQKLTPAQGEVLRKRITELAHKRAVEQGCQYPDISSLMIAVGLMPAFQAIEEHTTGPDDGVLCGDCKWRAAKITHTGPDAYGVKAKWTEYPERCTHKDARKGFCPEDRWGEKGE